MHYCRQSSDRPSVRRLSVVIFSHSRLLLWNRWTEFHEAWQEARSQRLQPSLCFSGRSEKQDGRPASDWLIPFWLLLWNNWTEFNETWQEARYQYPLPSLCFSGRLGNENCRPGRSVKKMTHNTQVHDLSPFGPLVFIINLKAYKLKLLL